MSFFGMGKTEPVIITLSEPFKATGLVVKTDMKNVFGDVGKILRAYMDYKNKYGIPNQKEPWEYVSLSKNFTGNQTWEYYTGHVVTDIGNDVPGVFISFEAPAGTYAVFPIKSKFRFMLGLSIGKTKRYIYNHWLAESQYEFAGYEFEYNNEKMFKENPNFIDLYVGVKEKTSDERDGQFSSHLQHGT